MSLGTEHGLTQRCPSVVQNLLTASVAFECLPAVLFHRFGANLECRASDLAETVGGHVCCIDQTGDAF